MKRVLKRSLNFAGKSLPESVRKRVPLVVAKVLGLGSRRGKLQARALETKLWGGFSKRAVHDLKSLKVHPDSPPEEVVSAARALACWYASRGDYQAAYDEAVWMRVAQLGSKPTRTQMMLEADCLMALGRRDDAHAILCKAVERWPTNPHLQLSMANTFTAMAGPSDTDDDAARLAWINRPFEKNGVARLVKADPNRPLDISNIRTEAVACAVPREAQAKVTVLIPAYSAEGTLHLALESLLAQTWENLEVIVVDDCSPDRTFQVAQDFAARDHRVIALRQAENAGAYAARNEGMRRATGTYITVHDADDWSHPQKIELQVRHLMEHPESIGNATCWVRCFHHLYFRRSYFQGGEQPTNNLVTFNTSSLMFRTEYLRSLGGWDEVRVAADTELRCRIERVHSKKGIPRLYPSLPLSFALESESSLTKTSRTHSHTISHGVRRDYRVTATYWYDLHGPEVPRLPPRSEGRAFPAPRTLLSRNVEPAELDILFVMDFALRGGAFVSTMNYVLAALQLGKRVGVFHWRRYELDVTRPPRPEIVRLVHQNQVTMISPGESVSAETVIVGYPVILRDIIDLAPEIQCQQFAIVTNQMCSRLYGGGDVQYDPAQVAENVERTFGVSPLWIPITELVRDLMVEDGRYEPIHAQTWTPLIDVATWCARKVSWRGTKRRRPVVGRHSRDHYTKWPTRPEAIRDAYCADRPCEVRLLGGADVPTNLLGRRPKNWVVHAFDAVDVRSFLADLDFYVHYPHEEYIEEFGRAVLEALAVGVPVILPPVFRSTFGEAALYAEPGEVWPLVQSLWANQRAWLSRVEAGRKFVIENSDWQQFRHRLEALAPSNASEKRGVRANARAG